MFRIRSFGGASASRSEDTGLAGRWSSDLIRAFRAETS